MSSVHLEPQDLPDPASPNHGMTLAAWVLNVGIVVGAIAAGIGMMIEVGAVLWTGVAIIGLALVAGGALRALGYGQPLK